MEPVTRLLITAHLVEGERRGEIELCLAVNEASFDEVVVVSEGAERPQWSNAKWIQRPARQRFADMLQALVEISGPNDLNVIANSDIVIPQKSVELMNANLKAGEAYCLAKWDTTPRGIRPWKSGWSQDVWCFRGRPAVQGVGDYYMGVPGCDNRFARELHDAGTKIANPMLSIPTYHLHLSAVRTNTNTEPHRVPAPYALVRSHYLGDTPEIELLDTFVAKRGGGSNALWRNGRLRTAKGMRSEISD